MHTLLARAHILCDVLAIAAQLRNQEVRRYGAPSRNGQAGCTSAQPQRGLADVAMQTRAQRGKSSLQTMCTVRTLSAGLGQNAHVLRLIRHGRDTMAWYREPARALIHRQPNTDAPGWRKVETDAAESVYLTGMDALNLPLGPLGDWHGAMWRPPAHTPSSTRTPATVRLCQIGRELWGTNELIDAREALRRIGHPAGAAAGAVWAASHPRAVAEMVMGALRNTGSIPDPDPRSARRWLDGAQRRACTRMLSKARRTLATHAQRKALDAWIREVSERRRTRAEMGA